MADFKQSGGPYPSAVASEFNPNAQFYGDTYLWWGTDGILQNFIVTSVSNKDRIVETTIEQGSGFSAIEILFKDGQDVEIETVDSSRVGALTIAQNPFVLSLPYGAPLVVLMVAQSATLARKREGMRSWTFKSFTAINLGNGNVL